MMSGGLDEMGSLGDALMGKMIKEFIDRKNGKEKDDEMLKSAILLMYNSSKERIFQVADNIAKGIVEPDENIEFLQEVKEPLLPDKEVWNFQLGDTVKIKFTREDFKWMQKETIGWRENLNQVHGKVGVVTVVNCKFENSIGVYFPEVYVGCSLYAGVLEKAQQQFPNLSARWKKGSYVKTITNQKVLKLLQRGLDQIPNELIGVKGRVVAVTHPCVIVTFDETKTYDLKSSSLVQYHDDAPLEKPEIEHARGFKVGDKVNVISNLKKLIENQKKYGGWNESMSPIRGKPATVINIQKDGSLNVQTKHFRAWRLNPDSVLSSEEKELEEDDSKFLPGNIVKVVVPGNVRALFAMAEIPSVFLEFLRSSAVLSLVDDDFDYYVRFNIDQNIQVHSNLIRKATTSEKEKHENIDRSVKELKVGDKVHLDIGPPNYVKSVLLELDVDPAVTMALTKSSHIVGFVNPYIAVIEYKNKKRFCVKKKYLTVPEKFHVDESKNIVRLEVIASVRDALCRSVQDIHTREGAPTEEWQVNTTFMTHGNPPSIEFKIESTLATFETVLSWMEDNSGWEMEALGRGLFLVRGVEGSSLEVKVGLVFNDESSALSLDHNQMHKLCTNVDEGSAAKEKVTPIASSDGSSRKSFQADENPKVKSLSEFSYMKLYNPALARNVYFPYVIYGQRRTPVEPVFQKAQSTVSADNVNYISNAGSVYIVQK